mgnify:CR=1 FL=1
MEILKALEKLMKSTRIVKNSPIKIFIGVKLILKVIINWMNFMSCWLTTTSKMMIIPSDLITQENSSDGLCHHLDINLNGLLVSETKPQKNLSPALQEFQSWHVLKAIKLKGLKSIIFVFIKVTEKKILLQSSLHKSPEESILKINGKLFILLVVTYQLLSAEPLIITDHSTQKNLLKSNFQDLAPTKLSPWLKNFTHFLNNQLSIWVLWLRKTFLESMNLSIKAYRNLFF